MWHFLRRLIKTGSLNLCGASAQYVCFFRVLAIVWYIYIYVRVSVEPRRRT